MLLGGRSIAAPHDTDLDGLARVPRRAEPEQCGTVGVEGADRLILVRGDGAVVFDAANLDYLDAGPGGVAHVGHGRSEIAASIAQQMETLEHFGTGGEITNPPAILAAEKIIEHAPAGIRRVSFMSSGAEAIDEAVRLVREYHYRQGRTDRFNVLSLADADHGSTLAGEALRGSKQLPGHGPALPGFFQIAVDRSDESWIEHTLRLVIETLTAVGPESVAAMFVEPVFKAATSVELFDQRWWDAIAEVLSTHQILLVLDEVHTGFGRTGRWFGAQHYNVRPDVMVVADGLTSGYLPLAALLLTETVATGVAGADGGGSYGGHATACAVAEANLSMIERDDLVISSAVLGARLLQELEPLRAFSIVKDVRGLGLLAAIELASLAGRGVASDVAARLRVDFNILIGVSAETLHIAPPLVISPDQISELSGALIKVLATYESGEDVEVLG